MNAGESNPNYPRINEASGVILKKSECGWTQYTIWEQAGCTGNSKVLKEGKKDRNEILAEMDGFNEKVIRSVSHYGGSKLAVFAEEDWDNASGTWMTENTAEYDEVTGITCTTVDYAPIRGVDQMMKIQNSIGWCAKTCAGDDSVCS